MKLSPFCPLKSLTSKDILNVYLHNSKKQWEISLTTEKSNIMKAVCDDQYSNQRPFKGLSIGAILGILIIGLILLSISSQASNAENVPVFDKSTQEAVISQIGTQQVMQ
ncbi:MAG: hypothetical protein ACPGJS_12060 [Flammeovirgaceae bacterium]